MLAAKPGAGERVRHTLAPARSAWLHVVRGRVRLGDAMLGPADGAGIRDETEIVVAAEVPSEVLLFDLP